MKDTISLSSILNEDPTTLNVLKQSIKTDGLCFVRIDMHQKLIKNTKSIVDSLFNTPQRVNFVGKYGTGYKETEYKHHYRMITGNYNLPTISNKSTSFSKIFDTHSKQLSHETDKLLLRLSDVMLKYIFKMTPSHKQNLTVYGQSKAGLLDIVRYKPNVPGDYYVAEHVDPGLFSLNLLSNACGMEFYSKSKQQWIKQPLGYGVIFCGRAAKEYSNMPDVRHRVSNNKVGRFTIWYEVGISEQIDQCVPTKSISDAKQEVRVDVYGTVQTIKIPKDARIVDLKNSIDVNIGIPMSKSRYVPPRDPIIKEQGDNEPIGNRLNWKIKDSYLIPVQIN